MTDKRKTDSVRTNKNKSPRNTTMFQMSTRKGKWDVEVSREGYLVRSKSTRHKKTTSR